MPNELPIEYDPSTGWPLPNQTTAEYVPPVEAKRKNYIIEPDLYGYQTGNYIPEGATVDETGNLFWKDTKEPIQMIRRPTVLPVVGTPDGNELVMPKLADLAGYIMGPLAAGKVPLKAGETLLGSGAVRTAKEPIYPLAKPSERWVNTTGQNDHLLETMTPDEFLSKGRPLKIDAESRETINNLKQHIEEGKPLDPLELHANGKEDGRHRAIAAKELGIKEVPVINFREPEIAPTFYSGLERAVETAKPTIATADQWLGYLRNQPGVKAEELQHVLSELPNGPITKEALVDIVKNNKVELKEIVKGDPAKVSFDEALKAHSEGQPIFATDPKNINSTFKVTTDSGEILPFVLKNSDKYDFRIGDLTAFEKGKLGTKFHQYQLPGGENYKEILLTLPNPKADALVDAVKKADAAHTKALDIYQSHPDGATFGENPNYPAVLEARKKLRELERERDKLKYDPFKSSHWDEPNVLAHIRMNDRTVPEFNYADFKVKPPKILYRGIVEGAQESGASGLGTAHLGKGIYSSADKSFAKKYASKGDIKELTPEEAFPKNPLELNGAGGAGSLLMDYIFKNTNFKNAREFHKVYPDAAEYVKSLGYDGVITNKGEEVVKYPINNKKTLHLEEIQSDWHQKGRKEGYKLSENEKARLDTVAETVDNKLNAANAEDIMGNPDLDAGLKQAVERKIITQKEADDYRYLVKNENGTVPDAPFKKNWDELAFKRAIRYAAENGYEGISWTPGEAQAARYDLSKQVNLLSIAKQPNGKYLTYLEGKDGQPLFRRNNGWSEYGQKEMTAKELEDTVGKEVAKKAIEGKPNKEGWVDVKDEGLKIGGEGMKAFYDKMLVDKANSLAKKYGAKVEQKEIPIDAGKPTQYKDFADWEKAKKEGRTQPIHYLPLTPELKKKALTEGFPLFTSSPTIIPVDFDPFERNKKFKLVPVQGNPFNE